MSMKRSVIYEFDPVIYPTRVWVSISPTYDDVCRRFDFLSDDSEEIVTLRRSEYESHFTAVATTFVVVDKKSRWKGVLVAVWSKSDAGVGVMSHESTHATDWMCDQFGVNGFCFKDGEARAYYAQWVANCIGKVLKGKVK